MLINPKYLLSEEHSRLQTIYAKEKYVVLKEFISEQETKKWEEMIPSLDARRVICGNKDISWEERNVTRDHPLYTVLTNISFTSFCLNVGNYEIKKLTSLNIWLNIYNIGEYINLHVDKSGHIQLVICLKKTNPENGGVLHLHKENIDIPIVMNPGDAMLFEATSIHHYTTPLIATKNYTSPQRIVLVIRYHLQY